MQKGIAAVKTIFVQVAAVCIVVTEPVIVSADFLFVVTVVVTPVLTLESFLGFSSPVLPQEERQQPAAQTTHIILTNLLLSMIS